MTFLVAPGIKGLKPYQNVIGVFFVKKKLLQIEIKNLSEKKKKKRVHSEGVFSKGKLTKKSNI